MKMFKYFDVSGNQCVDFGEFQKTMEKTGMYYPEEQLRPLFNSYDRDGSGTLETAELDAFFSKYLVQAVEAGAYKRPAERSVDFAGFMHLLYQVLCKSPGSTIQGKYAQTDKDLLAAGTGAQSSVWKRLRAAFQVLEDDFNRLDKNGDRVIDLTEITAGISTKKQAVEKVARVSYLGVMSD